MICKKHGEVPPEKIYVTSRGHKKCKFCQADYDAVYRQKKHDEILVRRKENYKKFYAENKERINAEKRAYYARTRKERLAQKRKYQQENRERIREKNHAWYLLNKKEKKESDNKYYKENKNSILVRYKAWRENNPELFKELNDKRVKELRDGYIRALLYNAGFEKDISKDIIELKKILIMIKRKIREV